MAFGAELETVEPAEGALGDGVAGGFEGGLRAIEDVASGSRGGELDEEVGKGVQDDGAGAEALRNVGNGGGGTPGNGGGVRLVGFLAGGEDDEAIVNAHRLGLDVRDFGAAALGRLGGEGVNVPDEQAHEVGVSRDECSCQSIAGHGEGGGREGRARAAEEPRREE